MAEHRFHAPNYEKADCQSVQTALWVGTNSLVSHLGLTTHSFIALTLHIFSQRTQQLPFCSLDICKSLAVLAFFNVDTAKWCYYTYNCFVCLWPLSTVLVTVLHGDTYHSVENWFVFHDTMSMVGMDPLTYSWWPLSEDVWQKFFFQWTSLSPRIWHCTFSGLILLLCVLAFHVPLLMLMAQILVVDVSSSFVSLP